MNNRFNLFPLRSYSLRNFTEDFVSFTCIQDQTLILYFAIYKTNFSYNSFGSAFCGIRLLGSSHLYSALWALQISNCYNIVKTQYEKNTYTCVTWHLYVSLFILGKATYKFFSFKLSNAQKYTGVSKHFFSMLSPTIV